MRPRGSAKVIGRAVLVDLLMAVMNSLDVWAAAAGDREIGFAWRDAVTSRMVACRWYEPYDRLVTEAADDLHLPRTAPAYLRARWATMEPWPDAAALGRLRVPYAFVTNASRELAGVAARRSGLRPSFTLSAEDAGWYKPRPEIYRRACELIGAAPSDVLFVAGSPYDADGAHAAGLRAVLVRRRLDRPMPASPVVVVSSPADLLPGGMQGDR